MSEPRATRQWASVVAPRPVLVVEDHPLVAEATSQLLAGCGACVEPVISATAADALERLGDGESEIEWFRIFLDLDVPGAFGLSLAREVEQRGMADRCCVVSAFENPEYISEIWSLGFLGYITKATPVAAFTAAIMNVLSGERSFPFASTTRRVLGARLTRRQTQLLEQIRAGRSSKEIANELHIAEGTVNNHVAAILQSLEASSRAHAVAKAIELGFLDSRPQPIAELPTVLTERDRSRYLEMGCIIHDPWLAYAAHHSEPIVASTLNVTDRDERRVLELAVQNGFVSAVLVPVHSRSRISVLCLGSSRPCYFEDEGFGRLKLSARMLAAELHDWWLARARRELVAKARITPGDLELLRHQRLGHSSKRIAAELSVSRSSINSRFQRMNTKLGVANRRMAARLASECGLIRE